MTERLLQFIWQFQHYNKQELYLSPAEPLQIIYPGTYNINQGPDFIHARIKINQTQLAGSIELHVRTSDWLKHKHDEDQNYRNIILHVVWENDLDGFSAVPILSLQNRVPRSLLQQYEQWMKQPAFIPCNHQVIEVSELIWNGWKDRLLAERLMRKSSTIQQYLRQNNHHWEETFWWLLARHFGTHVNASAFEAMARTVPIQILAKNRSRIHQLEALLMGQAGLLNKEFAEDYPSLLQSEYKYLQKKYNLRHNSEAVFFLRMRPGNFPTIRLAQLAMLIHRSSRLFTEIKETTELKIVKKMLDVTANDYWHYHYILDEASSFKPKRVGAQMINSLIINSIGPLLYTYGLVMNDSTCKNKAVRWLEETAPEKNKLTDGFTRLGVSFQNACDTQALIELKTLYCDVRRCLDCSIGNALLKNSVVSQYRS